MRISLKWLLIVVTYVAIAAAACVQMGPGWLALLWVGNVYFLLYAALVAVYYRGSTQAAALGFALFSVAATAFVFVTSSSTVVEDLFLTIAPSTFVSAAGYDRVAERLERLTWEKAMAASATDAAYRARVEAEHLATSRQLQGLVSVEAFLKTFEVIMVLLVGLIGCLVGRYVWKGSQEVK